MATWMEHLSRWNRSPHFMSGKLSPPYRKAVWQHQALISSCIRRLTAPLELCVHLRHGRMWISSSTWKCISGTWHPHSQEETIWDIVLTTLPASQSWTGSCAKFSWSCRTRSKWRSERTWKGLRLRFRRNCNKWEIESCDLYLYYFVLFTF